MRRDKRAVPVVEAPDLTQAAIEQHVLLKGGEELVQCPERRTRVTFMRELVAGLKAEHGMWKRDAANEAVVRKELFRAMREHGMRKLHIAEQMEGAVNAFFMLSDEQRVGMAMTASLAFQEDRRLQKYGYVAGAPGDRRYSLKPAPLK